MTREVYVVIDENDVATQFTAVERVYCKNGENCNFWKKGKIVILMKTQNFCRSRMTKWISPLESSREI